MDTTSSSIRLPMEGLSASFCTRSTETPRRKNCMRSFKDIGAVELVKGVSLLYFQILKILNLDASFWKFCDYLELTAHRFDVFPDCRKIHIGLILHF